MSGKNVASVLGIIFVIVALIGFLGGWGIVGTNGIFATDTMHDLVHLVIGLVLIIVAYGYPMYSSTTLMVVGIVYAIVGIWGFVSGDMVPGILVNSADDYLHILLALISFFGGYLTRSDSSMNSM